MNFQPASNFKQSQIHKLNLHIFNLSWCTDWIFNCTGDAQSSVEGNKNKLRLELSAPLQFTVIFIPTHREITSF